MSIQNTSIVEWLVRNIVHVKRCVQYVSNNLSYLSHCKDGADLRTLPVIPHLQHRQHSALVAVHPSDIGETQLAVFDNLHEKFFTANVCAYTHVRSESHKGTHELILVQCEPIYDVFVPLNDG